jgi:hypothetical protein
MDEVEAGIPSWDKMNSSDRPVVEYIAAPPTQRTILSLDEAFAGAPWLIVPLLPARHLGLLD